MHFVVKSAVPTGDVYWLSVADKSGVRKIGARNDAEVFHSRPEAQAAIKTMPPEFARAGVAFSIEPTS